MMYNENQKSAVKRFFGIALVSVIAWLLKIPVDIIILFLLIFSIAVFDCFSLDYDKDMEDIKNEIKNLKNNKS